MSSKNDIIKNIFCKFFKTKNTKNFDKLKMGQVKGWDSLGNLNFLLKLEEKFKIRFSIEQMSELKSIQGIKKVLIKK
jgi:acyl carrier protein